MKALLICPGERAEVSALWEWVPLSNLPILGKTLIEYWLEDLATKGAKEVSVLATDRPELVRALVGNGERWGLRIEVLPETRELTAAEARAKYRSRTASGWMPSPEDVRLMDHLPCLPDFPLFTTYADWIATPLAFMPQAATPDRLGVREIKPGVWVGLNARIASSAQLHAPCWIGDQVSVGPRANVGPMAIVERRAIIETDATISHSVVGEDTLVGKFIELHNSIALGNTLTNWKLNSSITVSDAFLLSSLVRRPSTFRAVGAISRFTAAAVLLASLPFGLFHIVRSALRGLPAFRVRAAVRPRHSPNAPLPGDRIIYYELANTRGWMVRWPQLWGVIRGDFAWIGNRPLTVAQAADLKSDFERLWLSAPLGLICLADAHGIYDAPTNDARAHASYYAVRASWRIDFIIFAGAMFRFAFGFPYSRVRDAVIRAVHSLLAPDRKAT
jgi:hypothetical protein